jgi:formylglycine-generating enzyme required for sulfatase activity
MNLTNQYIANPKSRDIYTKSLASYKSIRTTSTRLRVSDDRYVLNSRKKQAYFQVDGIGFNMLYCPRGMFTMGSDEEYDNNPKRLMVIKRPFLLGETEVTQELFQAVMGYNPSAFQGGSYPNSNQNPVQSVTWYDALMFCNKLSLKLEKTPYYNISQIIYIDESEKTNIKDAQVTYKPNSNGFRLPYEREWEYAAKAGTDNTWAGTNNKNDLDQVAWFSKNSDIQTHPVKSKRPNEWGFYDMSGNVSEWCWDNYKSNRAIRGGSWGGGTSSLYSARRGSQSPKNRNSYNGFRVSASLFN